MFLDIKSWLIDVHDDETHLIGKYDFYQSTEHFHVFVWRVFWHILCELGVGVTVFKRPYFLNWMSLILSLVSSIWIFQISQPAGFFVSLGMTLLQLLGALFVGTYSRAFPYILIAFVGGTAKAPDYIVSRIVFPFICLFGWVFLFVAVARYVMATIWNKFISFDVSLDKHK